MLDPRQIGGLTLATALVIATPAAANQLRSRFTVIEPKACTVVGSSIAGKTWRCQGLPGYPVIYATRGGQAFVSFGADAAQRQAARQTLRSRNTIFSGSPDRAIVEWRFRRRAGKEVPYATIVRYFAEGPAGRSEALVVTKVTPAEACHVAYLDAGTNREAMALARSAADELAPLWSCVTTPRLIGVPGKNPL